MNEIIQTCAWTTAFTAIFFGPRVLDFLEDDRAAKRQHELDLEQLRNDKTDGGAN